MYAIVEDGGKQYLVKEGQTVYLERRDLPEGTARIEFERVLMLGDGAESRIGCPNLTDAKVTARVEGEIKGPKLYIEKFRRRKGYHLRKGHRQRHLKVTVEKISG
jgi:large subunit ribosomal protein L21